MRSLSSVALVIILLLASCAGSDGVEISTPAETEPALLTIPGFMVLSSQVTPGGLVEAIAPAGEVEGSSAVLTIEGGDSRYQATGLLVSPEGWEPYYYFLIGLDSWAARGNYRVLLETSIEGDVLSRREYRLPVREREFKRTVISLNNRLTAIRSNTSAERQEQSRVLGDLLSTRNIDGFRLSSGFERTMPLDDIYVTSGFGDLRVYEYSDGSRVNSVHYGLDYRGRSGTTVYSPLPGRVVMAQNRIVTGNTVVIEHLPGFYSLYYHLENIEVSQDDVLDASDVIGNVGATGLATGSHLHWEFRINASAVDPDQVMEAVLLDSTRLSRLLSAHQ